MVGTETGSSNARRGQRRSLRNEPKFSAVSEAALRATLEFRAGVARVIAKVAGWLDP